LTLTSDSTNTNQSPVTRVGTLPAAKPTLQRRLRGILRTGGLLLPLAAFWLVLTLTSPFFLTTTNLNNLLLAASVLGILAIGTTVVIITEEIDLSIGAVEGLATVAAGLVIVTFHGPTIVGIGVAFAVGILVGVVNGWVTTRLNVPSFIVTLSTLGICTGLALQATNGQSIYGFPDDFLQIGVGTIAGIHMPVLIVLGLLIAIHFTLTYTPLGVRVYSVGGNKRAASLVGINVVRVKMFAFCLSAGAAALAGVVQAARLNSANGNFGSSYLLDAIAAVVIGGTSLTGGVGSVVGTALGVLVVATIHNGLTLWNVSPFMQTVVVGTIILAMGIATRRRTQA
jgi:ribose transport system permease protein